MALSHADFMRHYASKNPIEPSEMSEQQAEDFYTQLHKQWPGLTRLRELLAGDIPSNVPFTSFGRLEPDQNPLTKEILENATKSLGVPAEFLSEPKQYSHLDIPEKNYKGFPIVEVPFKFVHYRLGMFDAQCRSAYGPSVRIKPAISMTEYVLRNHLEPAHLYLNGALSDDCTLGNEGKADYKLKPHERKKQIANPIGSNLNKKRKKRRGKKK